MLEGRRIRSVTASLTTAHKVRLVTGVAGVIDSNLLEALLSLDQRDIGLGNFTIGRLSKFDDVHDCIDRDSTCSRV